jgi:hypothetical protein
MSTRIRITLLLLILLLFIAMLARGACTLFVEMSHPAARGAIL